MPERISPDRYFANSSLEETPYVIPMPVWILLGIAIIGLIVISVYAIHKT